jgi:hypothetical protein
LEASTPGRPVALPLGDALLFPAAIALLTTLELRSTAVSAITLLL